MVHQYDEDIILDLSDEDNKNIILDLKSLYDINGTLLNSFFGLFEILGIDDEPLIHKALLDIYKKSPSYISNIENYFDDDTNSIDLNEYSKIKLDTSFYERISDAYTTFFACYYYLNQAHQITSGDLMFTIESTDRIYSDLGRVYAHIMGSDIFIKQFSKHDIHSLGGESRAKKYNNIKDEIFKEWKSGSFYSYAQCAKKHAEIHQLSTKTIEKWLSKEFSKPKENA